MDKAINMKCLVVTALTAIAMLASCNGQSPSQTSAEKKEDAGAAESGKRRSENVVRVKMGTPKEFTHVTNLGSANIIYTQGDYAMEVEGDSAMLQYLMTSFDSNLLTVSMRTDGNRDFNLYGSTSNVTIHLSCPDLKCVSICGNGGFESKGKWSGDKIEVGVLNTGTLCLDTIECNTFGLQSTSVSLINLSYLKANEVNVLTRTSATVEMNVDAEELTILNDGKPKITLTGKATNLLIKNPKDEGLVNRIK